jgi:hypothetical protein
VTPHARIAPAATNNRLTMSPIPRFLPAFGFG